VGVWGVWGQVSEVEEEEEEEEEEAATLSETLVSERARTKKLEKEQFLEKITRAKFS
jgi:cell division protein FtsB